MKKKKLLCIQFQLVLRHTKNTTHLFQSNKKIIVHLTSVTPFVNLGTLLLLILSAFLFLFRRWEIPYSTPNKNDMMLYAKQMADIKFQVNGHNLHVYCVLCLSLTFAFLVRQILGE